MEQLSYRGEFSSNINFCLVQIILHVFTQRHSFSFPLSSHLVSLCVFPFTISSDMFSEMQCRVLSN